jgi:diguanylate cyclase (GGDEF)-like protein
MPNIIHVRVLLIDDDDRDEAVFRDHINRLRQHSVMVERVANRSDALARLDEASFHLVALDLNLGKRSNGLDVLREIRARDGAPPVIIVTGSGDEEMAAESMRRGAVDYVVKDRLSPELLEQTIRSALSRHAMEVDRKRLLERLAELSVTDDLTGVANRRQMMMRLGDEIQRSCRTGRPFALLMIDIDDFKKINDGSGHQAGDRVLRDCASAIRAYLRSTDFVARYSGDEFCVLLTETPPEGAQKASEGLLRTIEALPAPVGTASIGVAFWRAGVTSDTMLGEADGALYRAKQQGRNCVVAADLPARDDDEVMDAARSLRRRQRVTAVFPLPAAVAADPAAG